MEALRVERLSKDFGGLHALKNISFRVAFGERVAVIGPNGAGKTTLLNILNGQISATSGKIYLFGQDITHTATYRRAHLGQGRSFQVTSLFPCLTVVVNVLLSILGTKPHPFEIFRPITAYRDVLSKAKDILGAVALQQRKDDVAQALGYGEQRKLEITLSLALEPKLLLLDEPSCGLTAVECADIITFLRNLGPDITVIVVAHDMDLVFGLANRIIVLHYGEVIADGIPEEIRCDPRVRETYMGIEEGMGNVGTG